MCSAMGGYMAIIDSAEENAFLHSHFMENGYAASNGYKCCYFGSSDDMEEGKWTWVDGTDIANRYSNWNSTEPNADNVLQDYARFMEGYPDGTWDDCEYYEGAYFVCEWE